MGRIFHILNIGLDRDLIADGLENESQIRQSLYARELPAEIVHIVKCPISISHSRTLAGGKIQVFPGSVRHWAVFPWIAARLGSRLMTERTFDLIQVQEPFLCGPVGIYLSRRFRTPLVAGVFSDDIDNPHWLRESKRNRIVNPLGKAVLRRASVIRTDSRQMAQKLQVMGYTQTVFVPFLLTNADRFSSPVSDARLWRQRLLETADGPLILTVARLEPQKNLSMLLRAFARVREQISGTILAVAGEGSLRGSLEVEAEKLAPGAVRFLGKVSYERLPALFQAADLSALPSNHETSARVLSLGLLGGVPTLSTDTTGAREVIEDRVTGRIVPVGDLPAFTAALMDLCRDHKGREAMGNRARSTMSRLVSTEAIISGLRSLYSRAIDNVA